MPNDPDKWIQMIAQVILSNAAQAQAGQNQLLQLNMGLEDQKRKDSQFAQELALRSKQTDASVAESQARMAEANAATDERRYGLKMKNQADATKMVDDQAFFLRHGMYPEQYAQEQAVSDAERKAAMGESQINLTNTEAAKAQSELDYQPTERANKAEAFALEKQSREEQIAASKAQRALADREIVLKEEASRRAAIGDNIATARALDDYGRMLMGDLSKEKQDDLMVHLQTIAADAISKSSQQLAVMGSKTGMLPEDIAKLQSAIVGSGMSYSGLQRLKIKDPELGAELHTKMQSISDEARQSTVDGKLTPQMVVDTLSRQQALVKEYAQKAASRPTATDGRPSGPISLAVRVRDEAKNSSANAIGSDILSRIKEDPERFGVLERRIQAINGGKEVSDQDVVDYVKRYFRITGPSDVVKTQDLYRMVDDLKQGE